MKRLKLLKLFKSLGDVFETEKDAVPGTCSHVPQPVEHSICSSNGIFKEYLELA